MTILPATRTNNATVENNDNNSSSSNQERSVRRRDDHNISHASTLVDSSKNNSRRPFRRRSSTPEPSDHPLRKRFKESKPWRRRKQNHQQQQPQQQQQQQPQQHHLHQQQQQRDRKPKRSQDIAQEESIGSGNEVADVDSAIIPEACSDQACDDQIAHLNDGVDVEDATGFNSEDEYGSALGPLKNQHLTDEEWSARDAYFTRCLAKLGYEIKVMNEDGACLFRALADQIYGDQELHYMVRSSCMDYIVKNKDFFAAYVTEDFDKYIARKRIWNVHGNHLEIQALSEMYNRTIEVYCYEIKPINIFNGCPRLSSDEPIRLSYHRMCHYNSISNPNNPSVGVGLGLPSYHTADLNRRRMVDAVRASEELLIEQTMLEDKIKATDWEATNETLEEEVARESYIQYFRDAERRLKPQGAVAGSSSTVTSASSRRGSSSSPSPPPQPLAPIPSSSALTSASSSSSPPPQILTSAPLGSPKNSSPLKVTLWSSPPRSFTNSDAFVEFDTPDYEGNPLKTDENADYRRQRRQRFVESYEEGLAEDRSARQAPDVISDEEWDDGILAQILAESRNTYLDDLKRNSKRRTGSPGPSTST